MTDYMSEPLDPLGPHMMRKAYHIDAVNFTPGFRYYWSAQAGVHRAALGSLIGLNSSDFAA